jgi:hypothetical protein
MVYQIYLAFASMKYLVLFIASLITLQRYVKINILCNT